jgi:hypothetical protein
LRAAARTLSKALSMALVVPEAVMPRITGHGPGPLEEHLNLVRKHFSSREAIASYLEQREVKVQMGR